MRVSIDLNEEQSRVIQEMLDSGFRGTTFTEVVTRILDAAFIEFELNTKYPPEPKDRESWQEDDD